MEPSFRQVEEAWRAHRIKKGVVEADLIKMLVPQYLGGKDWIRDADHLHNRRPHFSLCIDCKVHMEGGSVSSCHELQVLHECALQLFACQAASQYNSTRNYPES